MKSVALVIASMMAVVLGVLEFASGSAATGGSTIVVALLGGFAGLVLANRRPATDG